MFKRIMVPVDMATADTLTHAVDVAADLAKHYGATLGLISVSGGLQGRVSHSHERYGEKLADFAAEMGARNDIEIGSRNISVPDPSVEVDQVLLEQIEAQEVDLVVIASHQPNWTDIFVNSHGGRLARRAPVSVFVVRAGG
ncbi:universal stress protein [Roseovarius faecimaris]|uniref:Universal stress protein n=1 Tax=Roseovarius faecimaris TaxID=2494550 RepID=A0A6I6ITS5_9RHOB|nr:universal stress protein [Roseovarius faecimaris]QGX99602.1 universal stress protein [Roseovarius faecimaris]